MVENTHQVIQCELLYLLQWFQGQIVSSELIYFACCFYAQLLKIMKAVFPFNSVCVILTFFNFYYCYIFLVIVYKIAFFKKHLSGRSQGHWLCWDGGVRKLVSSVLSPLSQILVLALRRHLVASPLRYKLNRSFIRF